MNSGFNPPPYPQDRLNEIRQAVITSGLNLVDLSIGTPCDPVPEILSIDHVEMALSRGYPRANGSDMLLGSAISWIAGRFGIDLRQDEIAACVGSKEFVASVAQYLRLRTPHRSSVLFPSVSYPTYEMGALLGGCKPIPVPVLPDGELDISTLTPDVLKDTLCIWLNSPANPTGKISSGRKVVELARKYNCLVISDECYTEFSYSTEPKTILEFGTKNVLALHSLSKRSNFAGGRVGFYAGDRELVRYLSEVRKHAGLMIPGMMQMFGSVLLSDQSHVEKQREIYRERLDILLTIIRKLGYVADFPDGGFYIWLADSAAKKNGFEIAREVAMRTGIIGSPGEFYGKSSSQYLRIAAVTSTETLAGIAAKL